MSIPRGVELKAACLNVNGICKTAIREEVERWLSKKRISILMIQETRTHQQTEESRSKYNEALVPN